ncbi:AAA family ATPase [Microvirga sp. P5_D2]
MSPVSPPRAAPSKRVHYLLERAVTLAKAAAGLTSPDAPFRNSAVPGLIPGIGLTVLYGPSGTGKSFLMTNLLIHIATGHAWGGRLVRRGLAVLIAGEDQHGLQTRAVAAAAALGANLQFTPMVILPAPGEVHADGFAEVLSGAIDQLNHEFDTKLSIIALDTLGGAFGAASQDDAGPMTAATGALLKLAEQHRCAVLAVHHTGKRGDGMRGSQVLFDRADAVIKLTPSPGPTGKIRGTLMKARNDVSGVGFSFHLAPYQIELSNLDPIHTCVVEDLSVDDHRPAMKASPKVRDITGDTRAVLETILRFFPAGEVISRDALRAAMWDAWPHKSDSARRKALSTSLDSLERQGLISKSRDAVTMSDALRHSYPTGPHDAAGGLPNDVTSLSPQKGGEGNGRHQRKHPAFSKPRRGPGPCVPPEAFEEIA